MRDRYDLWTDALITTYTSEISGIPLGARYRDVIRWLPAMRPYPGRGAIDIDAFYSVAYSITHVIYTLNDYNKYLLSPNWLPDEFSYLKTNLEQAVKLQDPETLGEFLDTLRDFGITERDPSSAPASSTYSRNKTLMAVGATPRIPTFTIATTPLGPLSMDYASTTGMDSASVFRAWQDSWAWPSAALDRATGYNHRGVQSVVIWNFLRLSAHIQMLPILESGEETLVGGQAVMEGVMMRAPHSYCVAVRKAERRDRHRGEPAAPRVREVSDFQTTRCCADSARSARRCGWASRRCGFRPTSRCWTSKTRPKEKPDEALRLDDGPQSGFLLRLLHCSCTSSFRCCWPLSSAMRFPRCTAASPSTCMDGFIRMVDLPGFPVC